MGKKTRKWSEEDKEEEAKNFITAIVKDNRSKGSIEVLKALLEGDKREIRLQLINITTTTSSLHQEHPSETIVFHNEEGNPAYRPISNKALDLHKGTTSANTAVMYSSQVTQDGDPLQDDVRLCWAMISMKDPRSQS
ncbi:hypothetical protein Tco_0219148 [Tanacetum coccineum]